MSISWCKSMPSILSFLLFPLVCFSQAETSKSYSNAEWKQTDKFSVVGFQQSVASSSDPSYNFSINTYVDAPITKKIGGFQLAAHSELKISSLPQQVNNSWVQVASEFYDLYKGLKVNQIVSCVDFLIGIELYLHFLKPQDWNWAPSIYFSIGATSPINPSTYINKFKLDDNRKSLIIQQYKEVLLDESLIASELEGKDYVAFVAPDIKSWYTQSYFGFRVKGYSNYTTTYPSFFEFGVGRNSFILRDAPKNMKEMNTSKTVILVSCSIPIELNKDVTLYFFGTLYHMFKIAEQNLKAPIFFDPASPEEKFPSDKFAILPIIPGGRDFLQIGIGIDILNVFSKVF